MPEPASVPDQDTVNVVLGGTGVAIPERSNTELIVLLSMTVLRPLR